MGERHSSPATPDQWALRWLNALPGGDSNVRAAFTCWVRHSARYVEAYCRQKMLDTELRGLDPERRIDVEELVRQARARIRAQGKVVPWPLEVGLRSRLPPPAPRSREVALRARPPRLGMVGLIFSMGVLMVGPRILLDRPVGEVFYSTELGQQQRLRLPDGSTALLNTQSRMQVQFSPQRREVRLVQGEALFTVAHDPHHTFRVYVNNTIVEDVGTRFDVRIGDKGTTIVVVDGRVKVMRDLTKQTSAADSSANTPVILVQQDEAFVSKSAAPVVQYLSPRELASLIGWTEGLVILDGMTLAQAVQEFNRYNLVQLQLADAEAGHLRLGGSFGFTRPLAFAASLEELGCEIASGKGTVIVISKCNSWPSKHTGDTGFLR
jgi:transmembrane sensor